MTNARVLSRFLLALAAATCLPARAASVPYTLTVANECGADKKEALADMPARPVDFCANGGTKLEGTVDATPALAGRRLTLAVDVDPAAGKGVAVQLVVMTFGPAWEPRTQRTVTVPVTQGRVEAGVYVPADVQHIGWTLSRAQGATGPAQLAIRRVDAQAGDRTWAPGEMSAACKTYLENKIALVKAHFLFIDQLQLDKVADELRQKATGAQDVAELDDTLALLARKLNEAERAAGAPTHSHFHSRAQIAARSAPQPGTAGDTQATPDYFTTELVDGHVGYVRLRTFFSLDIPHNQAYAAAWRAALVKLHEQGARRWVIDLRPHSGGNMHPAIAALRPLLGQGDIGFFIGRPGSTPTPWTTDLGNPAYGLAPLLAPTASTFDGTGEPVAVLLGRATSSSGEMIAIAFHGRPATRSFGTPSGGATTGISGQSDPYGNMLGIASTYAADRHGEKVFPRVMPDVAIDARKDVSKDPTLDAALAWLATQP